MARPSDDTAVVLLKGIKQVRVYHTLHFYGDKSGYEDFSKIRWDKEIENQLKENGLKIVKREAADGMVLLDIELATNKATEFVAINLRLSFVEELKIERMPTDLRDWPFNCITWQKTATLILNKNDLNTEVRKRVRNMGWHFCRVYLEGNDIQRLYNKLEKQHKTPVEKRP
jgi:hypothetical protein